MTSANFYPIGTPGQPWGESEREQWRKNQLPSRSYDDVLSQIRVLGNDYKIVKYGEITCASDTYALMALRSVDWDESLPSALITGGVHGYETSGVLGALRFLQEHGQEYKGKMNLLVAPCVSPWAFERISRWNYHLIDPNRSFYAEGKAEESQALMSLIAPLREQFRVHIDLHETTDSDESEFRPALAARDGKQYIPDIVPDGFYLVSDEENSQLDFQRAIIAAVEKVTHIAPSDAEGKMLGFRVASPGVVEYPNSHYHLCATMTAARYTTTTEVYPDSEKTNPEECIIAQVEAVKAALNFALKN